MAFLYRLLRDDELPTVHGLSAKNPLAVYTLSQHIENGSHPAFPGSQYISCSSELQAVYRLGQLNAFYRLEQRNAFRLRLRNVCRRGFRIVYERGIRHVYIRELHNVYRCGLRSGYRGYSRTFRICMLDRKMLEKDPAIQVVDMQCQSIGEMISRRAKQLSIKHKEVLVVGNIKSASVVGEFKITLHFVKK